MPDKIRAKLVEFKILKEYISTDGQAKDSILSMPVCFERININEDYKNDPKLNLATIDGKVNVLFDYARQKYHDDYYKYFSGYLPK